MRLHAPSPVASITLFDVNLIGEQGRGVETYYGKDMGDHIAMARLELFVARGITARVAA